jgi:hypothetical protein
MPAVRPCHWPTIARPRQVGLFGAAGSRFNLWLATVVVEPVDRVEVAEACGNLCLATDPLSCGRKMQNGGTAFTG